MTDDQPNPIDTMFDAMANGDAHAARAGFAPGARIWHGFDQVALAADDLVAQWEGMIAHSKARFVTDVRRRATDDGYVQQHLFVFEQPDGKRMAWPVCIVVKVTDGRIERLDEYIDRAGHFTPG